jgi:hypothetical protein
MTTPQDPLQMIARMLQPWQASLENPPQAQEAVLQSLLKIYAQTSMGSALAQMVSGHSLITGLSSLSQPMRITSP